LVLAALACPVLRRRPELKAEPPKLATTFPHRLELAGDDEEINAEEVSGLLNGLRHPVHLGDVRADRRNKRVSCVREHRVMTTT